MNANPALKKLGFSEKDRVVIIHTDDIGMCQSSVAAFRELHEAGIISSGAVMTPCPWFLEAVKMSKGLENVDLGVHLTLTSEWQTYRWGPISTRDRKSGLIDDEGFFYHLAKDAQDHAVPEYAHREMDAQISRCIDAGLNPSHVDTHMGTVAHPKFMVEYIQMSLKNGLPPMIFRMDEQGWLEAGLDVETAKMATIMMAQIEESGVPLLDHLRGMPLDFPEQRMERAKSLLRDLPPGLTHFIIHPAKDSPEIRAITLDWQCRVADFELFMQSEMKDFLADIGLHVIGYRELQNLLPVS